MEFIDELERTKARTIQYFDLAAKISKRPTRRRNGASGICWISSQIPKRFCSIAPPRSR